MQVQIETSPLEQLSADALAVIVFESESSVAPSSVGEAKGNPPAENAPAIAEQSGWLTDLRATGEFTGKLYEMAMLHRPAGIGAKRLVVIGGGKPERVLNRRGAPDCRHTDSLAEG